MRRIKERFKKFDKNLLKIYTIEKQFRLNLKINILENFQKFLNVSVMKKEKYFESY